MGDSCLVSLGCDSFSSGDNGSRWSVGLFLGRVDLFATQYFLGIVFKVNDVTRCNTFGRTILNRD